MTEDVTISFTCNTNEALLLMAAYDAITLDSLDGSIVALDSLAWLLDEIGHVAANSKALLQERPDRLTPQLQELIATYEELIKGKPHE